jgi:uncharacterized protein (TIGR00730 family)
MALSSWLAPRKSVCVFAGSRLGRDPAFAEDAAALGEAIAGLGVRLVYGAGDAGLIERVSRAAIAAGGSTLGVIYASAVSRDDAESELPLVVAETLHERKKVMFMNADALVALPGGGGSLDLLVEVMTWRQLGLHRKPIYLLNTAGYWDPLLGLIDHIVTQSFADPSFRACVEVCATVPELVARLNARLYRRQLQGA